MAMTMSKRLYGTMPDGTEVYAYTLDNGVGVAAEIISYGGIITKLLVKDKNGETQDVVLGRRNLEEYLNNDGYIGAAIGRHANRIANGRFELNGKTYNVGINEGKNSLHGGVVGFDKKVWAVNECGADNSLFLYHTSPDGDEGFPGRIDVIIKYRVTEENALRIEYSASATEDTVCNLTNHSYFNLSGHESGAVDTQILQINSGFYTPNDSEGMPTGEVLSVQGTPFDFRVPKPIGRDIDSDFPQVRAVGGFDHNFAISGRGFRKAAVAKSLETGITMEVITDRPAMQLYTANMLPAGVHKGEVEYQKHGAFCLETQEFPNAMEFSHYPGPILREGEFYKHITEYKFV